MSVQSTSRYLQLLIRPRTAALLSTKPPARYSSTSVSKNPEKTKPTAPAPARAERKYEVDISLFSPLLDPHPSETGPYHEIFFGSQPPFIPIPDEIVRQSLGERGNSATIESLLPYSLDERDLRRLMKFTLLTKRVVNQTGKGKIPSMYTMVVVGNGNGLVGCGEGKSERMGDAAASATKHAIKNLAPVNVFEGRTIHSELKAKFHATEIVMRPRPPGFGLRCSPFIHQVAKAAGISDLSAKVTRSNNPMNVIKMALMMLQSGGSPVGMGDGFGGKGKRLEKGIGMRTGEELALMRGRRCQPWSIEDID
ncbi:28S ribosomal protein S5, mitochondrial [Puccinia graminis f. sp. tritici]|uniref:Small ribosomal subunit protein uS5m n=1 Tax=Puccinia graminis f. sp. tritici TaxID=56615 RepID=A0A5B0MZ99_PUCGR|nr:28S ribosomal protein S5, mitochondrial [Puccinia graminis f. sp. tritici]